MTHKLEEFVKRGRAKQARKPYLQQMPPSRVGTKNWTRKPQIKRLQRMGIHPTA
jgi:hypothetical protein